jgi:predicted nucleotidyltransferase
MDCKNLHLDRERLADIYHRFSVARLEVFGSFTRGDAGPDSYLDILISFAPDTQTTPTRKIR